MQRTWVNGVIHFCFCSSVPNLSIPAIYSELLTLMMTPVEAQPREISSIAIAYDKVSKPDPPNCDGAIIESIPNSPSFLTC